MESIESRQELEHLEKNLELVNYWIDKADTKVSISLGLFPLLSAVTNYLYSTYEIDAGSYLLFVILKLVSIMLIFASIVFFVLALMPKLGTSGNRKRKKYPLYYGDIFRIKVEDYKSIVEKANESDYADELMNEIHYNSEVCYKKMVKYKTGIVLSIMSLFLETVCFIGLRFFCG